MPQPESDYLPDDALYWPLIGYDDEGQPVVDVFSPIKVHLTGVKRMVEDKDSQTIHEETDIVVGRDIKIGSCMFIGTEEEYYGAGSGSPQTEIYKVVAFGRYPDVRGNEVYREISVRLNRSKPPVG